MIIMIKVISIYPSDHQYGKLHDFILMLMETVFQQPVM